jgi:hypothetical protein
MNNEQRSTAGRVRRSEGGSTPAPTHPGRTVVVALARGPVGPADRAALTDILAEAVALGVQFAAEQQSARALRAAVAARLARLADAAPQFFGVAVAFRNATRGAFMSCADMGYDARVAVDQSARGEGVPIEAPFGSAGAASSPPDRAWVARLTDMHIDVINDYASSMSSADDIAPYDVSETLAGVVPYASNAVEEAPGDATRDAEGRYVSPFFSDPDAGERGPATYQIVIEPRGRLVAVYRRWAGDPTLYPAADGPFSMVEVRFLRSVLGVAAESALPVLTIGPPARGRVPTDAHPGRPRV